MQEIVYGVKEGSTECELIFPQQENIGLLVRQSILRNNVSEAMVGSHFYSIHYILNFFVFSKIYIVRDSSRRVSYLAFMVALEYGEKYDVLQIINELEYRYMHKALPDQSSCEPIVINQPEKPQKTAYKPNIPAFFYNDDQEIKDYFRTDEKYKQYEVIYFVNRQYNNLIYNTLKINELWKINEFSYRITSSRTQTDNVETPKNNVWNTISYLLIGLIVVAGILYYYSIIFLIESNVWNIFASYCLSIFIIVGISYSFLYMKHISESMVSRSEFKEEQEKVNDLIKKNETLKNTVDKLESSINNMVCRSESEEKQEIVNNLTQENNTLKKTVDELKSSFREMVCRSEFKKEQEIVNNLIQDNNALKKIYNNLEGLQLIKVKNDEPLELKPLSPDIEQFLISDCKEMKICEIESKIKTFDDWKNIKVLNGFSEFVNLVKKQPLKRQNLLDYIEKHKQFFNDEYEYVRFIKYLDGLLDEHLKDINVQRINTIKLRDVGDYYGFNDN